MPWLKDARALLEAWFPGQDDGDAVADILFGIISPSGKLPVTFGNTAREAAYATEAQYPGVRENNGQPGGPGSHGTPGVAQLVGHYTEDLQMGYRWYEANNVEPLFPFGFGLSYTTFEYSDLSVAPSVDPMTGHAVLTVTYRITNTGSRRGAEASQVYLTLPPVAGEPSKRLVGFQKVDLDARREPVGHRHHRLVGPQPPAVLLPARPERDLGGWQLGHTGKAATPSSSEAHRRTLRFEATVDLNVVDPPVRLQLVPGTIDLRGAPGRVTAVLSVPAPYSLLDLHITNVRFEGAPALTTAFSSDGRAMVATFDAQPPDATRGRSERHRVARGRHRQGRHSGRVVGNDDRDRTKVDPQPARTCRYFCISALGETRGGRTLHLRLRLRKAMLRAQFFEKFLSG